MLAAGAWAGTYHKRVTDQENCDEQAMLGDEQSLGDVVKVCNTFRAGLVVDERDKDIGCVH